MYMSGDSKFFSKSLIAKSLSATRSSISARTSSTETSTTISRPMSNLRSHNSGDVTVNFPLIDFDFLAAGETSNCLPVGGKLMTHFANHLGRFVPIPRHKENRGAFMLLTFGHD